jgi:hypothetical protein
MDIQFNENRFFLADVKFTPDIDYSTMISLLEKETWINIDYRTKPGWEDTAHKSRYEILNNDPQHPELKNILNFLRQDEVYDKALDCFYQWGSNMTSLFGFNRDELKKFAFWSVNFQRDDPDYIIDWHLDNRRLVATGMIFFTEKDDPNLSTSFRWESNPEYEHRMPTNFGDGWMHINVHQNLHRGVNLTNQYRYSAMLAMTIKHPDNI